MNLKKKLIAIFSSFIGVFVLGSIIYVSSMNASNKEVEATNIGDETYQPLIISTNGFSKSYIYVSFDNYETEQQMELTQKYGNYSYFVTYLPMSKVGSTLYVRDNNSSFTTSYSNSHPFYNYTTTNNITHPNSGPSLVCSSLASSYETKRAWFTLSSEVNKFLGVYNGSKRYMFGQIKNSVDNRYYYYVDIPVSSNTLTIQYMTDGAGTSKDNIGSSKTYTKDELHRINYVNVSAGQVSEYSPTGLDQYFINEYLKGFSTCLDRDDNGYNAYDPYILNMMSYYHLDASLLDDVYQDDYLKSDYDDGYKATSIRGGYIVSASSKLAELQSHYDEHHLRVMTLNDNDDNNDIAFVIILMVCSISIISIYPIYKAIKRH